MIHIKHQDIFDLLKEATGYRDTVSKHLICAVTLLHGYYSMCGSRGGGDPYVGVCSKGYGKTAHLCRFV